MERKIGEIFEYNGEWYQCVKSPDDTCLNCDMNFDGKCPIPINECVASARSDLSYVIFKKLEKVGEPTIINRKKVQLLKSSGMRNNCICCCFLDKNSSRCLIPKMKHENETFYVEIKQTKEDMEEKKLNLKPFDIQKAREGNPVCTRDGRKARIICFDKKDNQCPIVALVDYYDRKDGEAVTTYTNEGFFCIDKKHPNDLMMCPVKRTGYINIYDNNRVCKQIFETEGEAKIAGNSTPDKYIQTIKIEWEE